MNTTEFSNEFDVLYNQVNSNQAPGLDEYEKSVFLTKAQDEVVLMYFNPRGNKFMQGMDDAPDKQYDFSTLIRSAEYDITQQGTSSNASTNVQAYDPRSFCTTINEDVLLIINESVVKKNNNADATVLQVSPITYWQYYTQMQKPYKYPSKNIVWRLVYDNGNANNTAQSSTNRASSQRRFELVSGRLKSSDINNWKYRCRFLKCPNPIVLTDLSDTDLSIHGVATQSDCELSEAMHPQILQRAVELATAVYNPQALTAIAGVGNMSSTNLGIIPQNNSKE